MICPYMEMGPNDTPNSRASQKPECGVGIIIATALTLCIVGALTPTQHGALTIVVLRYCGIVGALTPIVVLGIGVGPFLPH